MANESRSLSLDSRELAFPRLTETQMAEVQRCTGATIQRYRTGEALFQIGQRDFHFFVVKSGEIEVVDPTDASSTIIVHGPGEFTGDVAHLTGTSAVVTAIARSDSEVYEVSAEGVRQLLHRCPSLGDVILRAFIARRQLLRESGRFGGLRVLGSRYSRDTLRIREFLARNRVPFTWIDLEDHRDVDQVLRRFGVGPGDTPVVIWGSNVLRNPANHTLAEAIGLCRPAEPIVYDLVIVGGGPTGLAAGVYAASEGLRTVVLERTAPGGQAASSMRIENYLGFPAGITGGELAERAVLQAHKFGAGLMVGANVNALTFEASYPVFHLEQGGTLTAKTSLIASGVDYRRLGVEGSDKFENLGIYYAATTNEAELCRGSEVVVVGGGNSAGQAAVFLSENVRKVDLVHRGRDLYESMSSYLAWRIEQTPNIEVLLQTTVRRLSGDAWLRSVELFDGRTGQVRTIETTALFSFIGAVPRTDWLPSEIERDTKGFVQTGAALASSPHWTAERQPFFFETSHPGIFAGGDVRAGSVKRVSSAVGEGAMAVQFVHEYLKRA